MRNAGAAGRRSAEREIPHARRAPAAVPDEQHGESGGSFLCACDAGGASMRLHVGFMMDPTADRGRDRVPPRSGCGRTAVRRPQLPPDGKFPMRPKRVRRACRSMGSGAGDRLTGGSDGSNGRRGRSSGCDRPRLRELMRMRGTRRARYLQTLPQIYSHAAYLTQPYPYADIFLRRICYCRICLRRYYVGHNATAAILRRYSLLQLYSTADILYCSYTHITYS